MRALSDELVFISVISKIELLRWTFQSLADEETAKAFIDDLHLLPLSDDIAEATIQLRRSRPKIKLPDAIIASTALVYDLTLITRNTSDFVNIQQLSVLDPFVV